MWRRGDRGELGRVRLAHRTGVSCLDPTKTPGSLLSSAGVTTFWPGYQFLDLEGTVSLVSRTDREAGDSGFIQASSPVSVTFTISAFTPLRVVARVCGLGSWSSRSPDGRRH